MNEADGNLDGYAYIQLLLTATSESPMRWRCATSWLSSRMRLSAM